MRLSDLQRYILKQTYVHGPHCARSVFIAYYAKPTENEVKIITKSLERLITKGLLTGYGHKTAEKWFTEDVSFTPAGRRIAKAIIAQQQRLPLKLQKKR